MVAERGVARERQRPPESRGRRLQQLRVRRDADPLSLDAVIHERMRLGIVSALAVHDSLRFNELKELLGASDGNLSVHARRLEEAGYVTCTKRFDGRLPRTDYRLTPRGRRALDEYLHHMEALIRSARRS